ncbi:MAG TPA: tRNA (N(6)-L-threonylcarbamoyladenosine(37)-C(2))-methylthiotransferase MtaB [Verrucomicrobiae bacterium]|nr:tRNA (N(6)-L-threonylcarbamoyladenosine(37)-C(2))-methylthiotransferase MtaB [Verrucomicrobiae bacterium]
MATFSIENFGCRATEADAAGIRHELLNSGLTLASSHDSASVIVLNTCTVTAAADAQAREAIRKIHAANPGACVIVTGCYAQRAPAELAAIPGVTWVVGNSHQTRIPGLVREFAGGIAHERAAGAADFISVDTLRGVISSGAAKVISGDIFEQLPVQFAPSKFMDGDRTRPILKLQDGCSNRCSYCVIPFVRGRSRSLPPDQAISKIRALADAGVQEIVLSGINLGSYGRDLTPRVELAGLLQRILTETSIPQLRFSSIEPQDVTEDFVSLMASSTRVAPHFHIPLQSGSDRVLKAMHRWYRAAHYAERVRMIRRVLPDAAIGADVIVGFPGETDKDFSETIGLIRDFSFTYLHVFSFSARPGTAGATLNDRVPPNKIRERARALRALARQKSTEFRASQSGRVLRALTLARGCDAWTEAITGNYLKVRIRGRHAANSWVEVRVGAEGNVEAVRA